MQNSKIQKMCLQIQSSNTNPQGIQNNSTTPAVGSHETPTKFPFIAKRFAFILWGPIHTRRPARGEWAASSSRRGTRPVRRLSDVGPALGSARNTNGTVGQDSRARNGRRVQRERLPRLQNRHPVSRLVRSSSTSPLRFETIRRPLATLHSQCLCFAFIVSRFAVHCSVAMAVASMRAANLGSAFGAAATADQGAASSCVFGESVRCSSVAGGAPPCLRITVPQPVRSAAQLDYDYCIYC